MSTSVSRIIKAPRRTLYQAFVDPQALVAWLPPQGMTGHVHAFDARQGGTYRMFLRQGSSACRAGRGRRPCGGPRKVPRRCA
jgi:uncharacterized protein YndB with AHSA1/START domain